MVGYVLNSIIFAYEKRLEPLRFQLESKSKDTGIGLRKFKEIPCLLGGLADLVEEFFRRGRNPQSFKA